MRKNGINFQRGKRTQRVTERNENMNEGNKAVNVNWTDKVKYYNMYPDDVWEKFRNCRRSFPLKNFLMKQNVMQIFFCWVRGRLRLRLKIQIVCQEWTYADYNFTDSNASFGLKKVSMVTGLFFKFFYVCFFFQMVHHIASRVLEKIQKI